MVEEAEGKSPRSTLERLRQLQKEMEVEDVEFVHSMKARMKRAEELKKKNVELEERLKVVKEEVTLVEAQLWEKEESMQILWEMCRRMKRDLDRGEEASQRYQDVTERTARGTQRTTQGTRNDGQAFSTGNVQQIFHKVGPQCVTPIEFAPRVCSSPMPSPIKHQPINYDSSVSLMREMESRLVSPERQDDTGNVSRSRMIFGPEIINAKESGVFELSEKNSPSDFTDSLRKRRLADLSDPDLQIIASRQRIMGSDFQGNLFKVGKSFGPEVDVGGNKISCSNLSEVQSKHLPTSQGLSGKLEEVKQAVRQEASRFKGKMEVVGKQVEGQAHRLAVLHERAMKEAILMAFEDMGSPMQPPSARTQGAGQGNLHGHSFVDLSSLSTSSLAHG